MQLSPASLMTRTPHTRSLLLGLATSLCFTLWWLLTRTALTCEGLGDCVKYSQMAQAFASGSFHPIDAPFNTRIAAPWIVSRLSGDPVQGFLVLNGIAALIFVTAWYGIARQLGLRNIEFFALVLWFHVHPLGFGLYHAMPESVDPMAHAMLAAVTWMYFTRHRLLLPTLLLALLTKESFTFICLVMIAAELVHVRFIGHQNARESWRLIAGIIAISLAHKMSCHMIEQHWFSHTPGYSPTTRETIRHFWHEATRAPARFVVWLTAVICVVGTFPILWLKRWQVPKSAADKRNTTYLLLGCAGFTALGLVGGSDMSRIIFTGNLLVVGAMLLPMNGRLPPVCHTATALTLGLLLALNYTRVLPSTLEYDYYMHGHRLAPTLYVLMAGCALLVVGGVVTRTKKPTSSCDVDLRS